MKAKSASQPDELRMKAGDFDRIMRGALGVAPPTAEAKPKARKVTKAKPKSAKKK